MLKTIIDLISEYLLILKKQIKSLVFTKPPEKWQRGIKGNIILLPGFAETWIFLDTISNALNQLGFRIYVIKPLGRNLEPIEIQLEKVKKFIEFESIQEFILLSHSKGGLVAKLLLDDPIYSERIKKSISIAVPYKGSLWGLLYIFSLKQLVPKSNIIERVNASSDENSKIVNLYPKLDNHIIPNRNLLLGKAKNMCINIIGHSRILESKETLDNVIKKIH